MSAEAGESGAGRWADRAAVMLPLCLAGAFLVYGTALGNGFYNDDALFLNQAQRILHEPSRLFTERPLGYFRPVYSVYVVLQWALFGLHPAGDHALGVAVHGLTTFLVYRLARRFLRATGPALLAAAAFLTLFAHSEASLWIAAQNSSLVIGLALLSVLLHLRAVERGGVLPFLLAVLAVVATLYCKEPGIVVIGWMPVAEAVVFGLRRCFSRASLLRYGALLALAAAYVLGNARFGQVVASGVPLEQTEFREGLQLLSVQRLSAIAGGMFLPGRVAYVDVAWWSGLLVLGGVLLAVAWLRRDLLPAAAGAIVLLLSAAAPAATIRSLQDNGARVYYGPTVGAALLVGLVAALTVGPGRATSAWRAARVLGTLALLAACVQQALAIRAVNRSDYQLISRLQTRFATQIGESIAGAPGHAVMVIEPWTDNSLHAQEFLQLFQHVDPHRVKLLSFDRSRGDALLAELRAPDPAAPLLDWDEERGLVPAVHLPDNHESAQSRPHAAVTGVRNPRIKVLRIEPR